MATTPRVYSYIRFSHISQAEGASSERQLGYAVAYAKKVGLPLDETLRDEGLSAFNGEHVAKGALGRFLAAVRDGTVAKGSTLIVEGFDRLSRADALSAQSQLAELINAGIVIVTAADNKTYSKKTLQAQPMDLIYSLLCMIRANEESSTKSTRVRDAIRRQCQGWVDGTYRGLIRTGNTPGWLRVVNGKFEAIAEQVATIHKAAALYRKGQTATQIAKALHAAGHKIGTREPTSAHVTRLLTYPSLVGTKETTIDGETFVLEDYYPPVMSRDAWNELQQLLASRTRKFVRGDVPSVLTGLGICACGYCGAPMRAHTMTSQRKPDGSLLDCHRRLMCSRSNYGGGCVREGSCSAAPIEKAILSFCSEAKNLRSLVGGDSSSLRRHEVAAAEAELAAADKALARLTEVMLASEGKVGYFAAKGRELEAARAAAQAKVEKAEQALKDSAVDMTGLDKRWRAVVAGVNALDPDSRMIARGLVADLFEAVVVYHSGHPGAGRTSQPGRYTDITLKAKGGGVRKTLRALPDGTWIEIQVKDGALPKPPVAKAAAPVAKKAARARAIA